MLFKRGEQTTEKWTLPAIDNPVKDVTKQYAEHVKTLTPEEKREFSSPHVFVWSELISASQVAAKLMNAEQQVRAFQEHQEEIEQLAKQIQ